MDDRLVKLLFYTRKGWPVLPLHWMQNSQCSCGDAGCRTPGKHPLLVNGIYGASAGQAHVRAWHKQWPDANWDLATGAVSGLVVIDIDPRNCEDLRWENLFELHPEPIETITDLTGGGVHSFFSMNWEGNIATRHDLWPGIAVQAENGLC